MSIHIHLVLQLSVAEMLIPCLTWAKMDGLGRHMNFLSDEACICMDAKTPVMENKIFFPRLHCENGKIVFYSMETCRYHTFDGGNVDESFIDFFQTIEHIDTHAWIKPCWSLLAKYI